MYKIEQGWITHPQDGECASCGMISLLVVKDGISICESCEQDLDFE